MSVMCLLSLWTNSPNPIFQESRKGKKLSTCCHGLFQKVSNIIWGVLSLIIFLFDAYYSMIEKCCGLNTTKYLLTGENFDPL